MTKYAYVKFVTGVFEGTSVTDTTQATKQTGSFGTGNLTTANCYASIIDAITYGNLGIGDYIIVSNVHLYTYIANTTYDYTSTISIISVNDINVTQELLGAKESTGVFILRMDSAVSVAVTLFSMKFSSGSYIYIADDYLKLKSVRSVFSVVGGGRVQPQSGVYLNLIDSTLDATPYLSVYAGGVALIDNLKWTNKSANLYCFYLNANTTAMEVVNTDFTIIGDGTSSIVRSTAANKVLLRNCKLSASHNLLYPGAVAGTELDLISCDAGNGYHYFYNWRYEGEITESTLTYLHAKYDATNKYSALVNSSSHANIGSPLKYKIIEMAAQNLSLTDTTYRVNILLDTDTVATLTDANFWVELSHNDNVSLALGKVVSSRNTDILATGTELALSSEVWQGTLPTNTKAYQVDITLSAAQLTNVTNGNVVITVNLAVANADVYVCPAVMIGT